MLRGNDSPGRIFHLRLLTTRITPKQPSEVANGTRLSVGIVCLLIPGYQESLLLNSHTPGGAEGHMLSFRMETVLQREYF